jgi:hypothetical protein
MGGSVMDAELILDEIQRGIWKILKTMYDLNDRLIDRIASDVITVIVVTMKKLEGMEK